MYADFDRYGVPMYAGHVHVHSNKFCILCLQKLAKDGQTKPLPRRMHSMSDTVRIHAHLLPAGAFSVSDTLPHPDVFAHTKGPTFGRHTLHHTRLCTANDLVDARFLNDMHITSTSIDSQIGVADRLQYCVKEPHMSCQHATWMSGLLSF